ncbi:polysaccharide biosynthesis C-terminal domain-containing protein, partial [candidate division KSB1 bacterium]|nr:polysaccharide biosynthesis C-terminal domain-containing protein [candidate division KSB1 bacterium]
FESIFQAQLRMGFPVICNMIDNLMFALLIFVAVKVYHVGLMGTAVIYVVCNLPGALLLVYRFLKTAMASLQVYWKTLRYLFHECLPLAAYLFFSILTTKIDVLMLSWMKGEAEVGLYAAATRLVYPLSFLSTSLTISLFPLLAKYFITENGQFVKLARLGMKYVFLIGLIVSVPLAFASEQIIRTLYIPNFAPSAPAFQLLIIALGFGFLNFYFIDLFITTNRQKLVTMVMAVSLLVNVGLNGLLIPGLSIVGAGYAKLASTLVAFLLLYYMLHRTLRLRTLLEYGRIIPAALLFIALQFFIKKPGLLWHLPLSLAAFVLILLLFRVFHYEERKYFITLFRLNKFFHL